MGKVKIPLRPEHAGTFQVVRTLPCVSLLVLTATAAKATARDQQDTRNACQVILLSLVGPLISAL